MVYLRLKSLFLAGAETQTGGIPLKIYPSFRDQIQIMDSFGTVIKVRFFLSSVDIEVPLILMLS